MERVVFEARKQSRTMKADRTYVSSLTSHTTRPRVDARRRPLRTYGKRTASTDPIEPATKKRRVEDAASDGKAQQASTEPTNDVATRLPPSPKLPPLQPAKKGTIMSYFKVTPTSSSSAGSRSEPTFESTEPASSPPSSPPTLSTKRKAARRLRTRVLSRDAEEGKEEEEEEEEEEKEAAEGDPDPKDEEPTSASGETTPSRKDTKPLVETTSPHTLDQATNTQKRRSDAGKRGKSPRSATVQTTLSLSMTDAGFTECNECGMLYNPFHAKDATFHARRHAALRKVKSDSERDTVG